MRTWQGKVGKLALLGLVSLALVATGCKRRGRSGPTFKEMRTFVSRELLPVTAAWQAAEIRLDGLPGADAPAGLVAMATEQERKLTKRFVELLDSAPAPLPLRAPIATLRRRLEALDGAEGDARAKAVAAVQEALQDLADRNMNLLPAPDAPVQGEPALDFFWRIGPMLRLDAGPMGNPTAYFEAVSQTLGAAQPSSPAEGLGIQVAQAALELAKRYLESPPTVPQDVAVAYQSGQIDQARFERAVCVSMRIFQQPVAGFEELLSQVTRACATPGACPPAVQVLPYHPLVSGLEALSEKTRRCARLEVR